VPPLRTGEDAHTVRRRRVESQHQQELGGMKRAAHVEECRGSKYAAHVEGRVTQVKRCKISHTDRGARTCRGLKGNFPY
jgi:hypothetical protein